MTRNHSAATAALPPTPDDYPQGDAPSRRDIERNAAVLAARAFGGTEYGAPVQTVCGYRAAGHDCEYETCPENVPGAQGTLTPGEDFCSASLGIHMPADECDCGLDEGD